MNSKRGGFQHLVQSSTLKCVYVGYVVVPVDRLYVSEICFFFGLIIRRFACNSVSDLPSYTPVESSWRFWIHFWLFSWCLEFSLFGSSVSGALWALLCREHIIVVKG